MDWIAIVLTLVGVLCFLFAAGYWWGVSLLLHQFFEPSEERSDVPVTFLKPLHGASPELAENLRSFCRQEYSAPGDKPNFRIVLGVAEETDPAFAVAQQVREEFPTLDITIVTGAPVIGANAKVCNLAHMAATAGLNDVFIISDADVRVPPDWLRRVVTALDDESVGLASCFYRIANPPDLPNAFEAMLVNVDFPAGVLVAERMLNMPVTLGATMVLRRSALEAVGGFEAIANHLADDYQLGQRIAAAGYRVVTVNDVVDIIAPPAAWGASWAHQVRWARTYRVCQPAGYFFSVLVNSYFCAVPIAMASVLRGEYPTWEMGVVMAIMVCTVLGVRALTVRDMVATLTAKSAGIKTIALLPLRDLMNLALWVAAFAGNTVQWGGRTFRVARDGTMKEVARAK